MHEEESWAWGPYLKSYRQVLAAGEVQFSLSVVLAKLTMLQWTIPPRIAWSIYQVPGQPGLHSETQSWKTKQNL